MMLPHDTLLDEVFEHQRKPYLRSDQRHQYNLLVFLPDFFYCPVPHLNDLASYFFWLPKEVRIPSDPRVWESNESILGFSCGTWMPETLWVLNVSLEQ